MDLPLADYKSFALIIIKLIPLVYSNKLPLNNGRLMMPYILDSCFRRNDRIGIKSKVSK